MVKLLLKRDHKKAKYTIGNLYLDGKWICNTLEDVDRGLTSTMPLSEIKKKKVYAQTAIPTGTYNITLNVSSGNFGAREFYKNTCNGKLPRLLNVPGFSGILMHCGANQDHSSGCLLVGYNKIKGMLVNSKEAFTKLYNLLKERNLKGESISITIE